MKFYIASSWNNRANVCVLAEEIKRIGHVQTHDWTTHDIYDGWEVNEAHNDIQGVLTADVLVLLLPAGYGSHVELGLAIAQNKPVLVCGAEEMDFVTPNGYCCPFYWSPCCRRVVGGIGDILQALEVSK